jgi:hypothetical protein
MAKVLAISWTADPPEVENAYCTMNKSGKLGPLRFWVGSGFKVWPIAWAPNVAASLTPLGVSVRSGCKPTMLILSAMLAASVPVDPITRIRTLGRGLATDRALLTDPHRQICICCAKLAQPSCNIRNSLYLSIKLKWAQGLELRFGNPVRSGLAAFTHQN